MHDVETGLRQKGFVSLFTDEDWMRENSSSAEWQEHVDFRVEYAREVLCSADTSAILYCDEGKYDWVSAGFADRIRERMRLHGPTESLFGNPRTRHLVQLTAPQQRLSKILELSSEADRARARERTQRDHHNRETELSIETSVTSFIARRLRSGSITEATISSASMAAARLSYLSGTGGPFEAQDPAPRMSDLRFQIHSAFRARVFLEARVELQASAVSGAIFPRVYLHETSTGSPPGRLREDGMLFFHCMFARQFVPYLRFDSFAELVLCCAAFAEAVALSMRCMADSGWNIQVEQS